MDSSPAMRQCRAFNKAEATVDCQPVSSCYENGAGSPESIVASRSVVRTAKQGDKTTEWHRVNAERALDREREEKEGSSSPVSRILFRKRLRACSGDHLSATRVTARLRILRSVLPTCASASRVIRAVWHCSRWGLPGRRIAAPPVRSYRTFSPLPLWESRVPGPESRARYT